MSDTQYKTAQKTRLELVPFIFETRSDTSFESTDYPIYEKCRDCLLNSCLLLKLLDIYSRLDTLSYQHREDNDIQNHNNVE